MDYSGHIGIIGGGIAGLTLGCSLLKEGIPAIIFEKSPEETSHGAAISLSSTPKGSQSTGAKFTASAQLNPVLNPAW